MSIKSETKTGKPARKRDVDATRNALLMAAQTEFQRAGYDSASTRQIASDAGCNVALINRYFGSKLGLFRTVMGPCLDLTPLAGLTSDQLASALANIALGKTERQDVFDPVIVAIRSSGSRVAQEVIRSHLGDPMVDELASLIEGDHADQKAGMVLNLISGLFVGRVSIGAMAISKDHDDIVRQMLSEALRAVLLSKDISTTQPKPSRSEPQVY